MKAFIVLLRWRVWYRHRRLLRAQRLQDRAYDALVRAEGRWR